MSNTLAMLEITARLRAALLDLENSAYALGGAPEDPQLIAAFRAARIVAYALAGLTLED